MATFREPTRCIHNHDDLEDFKEGETLAEIMLFVKTCAEASIGKKTSDVEEPGTCLGVEKFVAFVNKLKRIVDETPPEPQPGRFGNKAFRTWHAAMVKEAVPFLEDLVPPEHKGADVELMPYLTGAFGNEVRIDYGTGHELFFALFFLCLFKLRIVGKGELSLVVLRAFDSYLGLMRLLQDTYMLEPAGSHGVWGLDDYHCLVFLWGAAQLCKQEGNDEFLPPKCIHEKKVLEEYSNDYLYFGAIQAIKRMKTGAPFAEIAPMLNDISQLPEWPKLLMGLLKYFQAEVLLKLPVVQHVPFGSIIVGPCPSKGEKGGGRQTPSTVFTK
jgi:hypothetical protein